MANKKQTINMATMEKATSLQKWGQIIETIFNQRVDVDQIKDREIIYGNLDRLKLPREDSVVFGFGSFPTRAKLKSATGVVGLPYWISAVPNPKRKDLTRQSKLNIASVEEGWQFLSKLKDKEQFKIIVCLYPQDYKFKGIAVVSNQGQGIAEFAPGDRHYLLSWGQLETDPMIFNKSKIVKVSNQVEPVYQRELFDLVKDKPGYFEFQYGLTKGEQALTFFDYATNPGYLKIDQIWQGLTKIKKTASPLKGLPASTGSAQGRCVVLTHKSYPLFDQVRKGDIIVSDITTPEMTQIMAKASAIVTELGGVTSHAAIVCRELGIPAIVGVKKVRQKVNTGDCLSVDGNKGVIEVIK